MYKLGKSIMYNIMLVGRDNFKQVLNKNLIDDFFFKLFVLFLFLPVDEEDEYECVTVLNSHTQDVKHVVWHPTQEVNNTLLRLHQNCIKTCDLCTLTVFTHFS